MTHDTRIGVATVVLVAVDCSGDPSGDGDQRIPLETENSDIAQLDYSELEVGELQSLAAQGNAEAQVRLANSHYTGGDVSQDEAAAQPIDLSAGGWERDLRLRPAGVTLRSESRLSPILVWRRG